MSRTTWSDTGNGYVHHVEHVRVGTRELRTCVMVRDEDGAEEFRRAVRDLNAWAAEEGARATRSPEPLVMSKPLARPLRQLTLRRNP